MESSIYLVVQFISQLNAMVANCRDFMIILSPPKPSSTQDSSPPNCVRIGSGSLALFLVMDTYRPGRCGVVAVRGTDRVCGQQVPMCDGEQGSCQENCSCALFSPG